MELGREKLKDEINLVKIPDIHIYVYVYIKPVRVKFLSDNGGG